MKLIKIEEHDKFPTFQELQTPDITVTEALELEIVVVSHRWESKAHPDPTNQQFEEVKKWVSVDTWLFYDYSSLPQGNRNDVEEKIFRRDLVLIDELYKRKKVLILEAGSIDYHTRGWCFFEWYISLGHQIGNVKLFPDIMKTIESGNELNKLLYEPLSTVVKNHDVLGETFSEMLNKVEMISEGCTLSVDDLMWFNDVTKGKIRFISNYLNTLNGKSAFYDDMLMIIDDTNLLDCDTFAEVSTLKKLIEELDHARFRLKILLPGKGSEIYSNNLLREEDEYVNLLKVPGLDPILLSSIHKMFDSIFNEIISVVLSVLNQRLNDKRIWITVIHDLVKVRIRDADKEMTFKTKSRMLRFLSCLSVTNQSDVKFLTEKFKAYLNIVAEEALKDYSEIII